MTKFDENELLKRFKIDLRLFKERELSWDQYREIYDDFINLQSYLQKAMESVRNLVHEFPSVHSVRARIKDPWHLIEKCIRKELAQPERKITVENYKDEITDLVGIRAIHLYKNDWLNIHKAIRENWELHEEPIAYHREGDPAEIIESFKKHGCTPKVHPKHYRSVHYLANTQLTKRLLIVEIQVRTIFEEGWSEVDHTIQYPHGCDPSVAQLLGVLNRLAGSADEMATYLVNLDTVLRQAKTDSTRELQTRDDAIEQLKKQIGELKIANEEKEKILNNIYALRDSASQGGASLLASMAASIALNLADPKSEMRSTLIDPGQVKQSPFRPVVAVKSAQKQDTPKSPVETAPKTTKKN